MATGLALANRLWSADALSNSDERNALPYTAVHHLNPSLAHPA